MKTKTLVIDGKNQITRNFFAYPRHLANQGGQKTSMIHGSFLELFRLVKQFNPEQVLITWDRKSAFRRKIYPDYKKSRRLSQLSDSDFANYQEQHRMFKEGVAALGYLQWEVEDVEGDDLIGRAVFSRDLRPITIVSTDHDFWQLIRKDVQIFDIRTKTILTWENFQEITKFEDSIHHLAYKVIKGDSGDGVPPAIPRIATEKAKRMALGLILPTAEQMLQLESVHQLEFDRHGTGTTGYNTPEIRAALARNFKLVSLHAAVALQGELLADLPFENESTTWEQFLQFCQKYELALVMKSFAEAQLVHRRQS